MAAGRQIRQPLSSKARKMLFQNWLLALFLTAICFPYLIIMPDQLAKGENGILAILVFVAVAIGFWIKAVRQTLHCYRNEAATVNPDLLPGLRPGDKLDNAELRLAVRSAKLDRRANALFITYPPFRNLMQAFIQAFFAILFIGATVFWWIHSSTFADLEGIDRFALYFAGTATLLTGIWLVGSTLYSLGNSLKVTASPGGITVERHFLGIRLYCRHRDVESSTTITTHSKPLATGEFASSRNYYRLLIENPTFKPLTVGDGINDPAVAKRLCAIIARAAGINDPIRQ